MRSFLKKAAAGLVLLILAGTAVPFLFPENLFDFLMRKERESAGFAVKEVTIDGQRIVYLENAAGKETLVLLHGLGADKDNWLSMMKNLRQYHAVIPDIPGFGDSGKSADMKYDAASQAERIARFVEKLGLRDFYLAGNSMGGNIAGLYAAAHPEKVKGLILVASGGIAFPVKSDFARALEKGEKPLLIGNTGEYRKMMAFVFHKTPQIPGFIERALVKKAVRNRPYNEKAAKDLFGNPALLEGHFGRLTMPTLILWGDRDRMIDVANVPVFEKGIKNHTTRILKDCGHVPMVERPEETALYIDEFIRSVK
jgi:pimeloyl-ACP methyl ester carboxylesterase